MTTPKQEKDFKKHLAEQLPNSFLQDALDWIRDNMTPEEVFGQETLNKFVGATALPGDVFSEEELKQWAESDPVVRGGGELTILKHVDRELLDEHYNNHPAYLIVQDALYNKNNF